MKKSIISIILVLIIALSFVSCKSPNPNKPLESIDQLEMDKETMPTYLDSIAKEKFIISTNIGVGTHKYAIDENGNKVGDAILWTDEELLLQYQTLKESGINLTPINIANPDYVRHLEAGEEVGVSILIYDAVLNNILLDKNLTEEEAIVKARQRASLYENYECFYGHSIIDEPNASLYADLKFAEERYKQVFPNKMFFVNLFPCYSNGNQRGTVTYKEYLEKYVEIMTPNYLCYDHYPIFKGADGNTEVQDTFLYNMAIAQSAGKGIDIWTYLQCIGYSDRKDPDCVEDIRIQTNSALAFGLKGILWFFYWTLGRGGENFTNACINWDGTKTHRYDYVKQATNEIHDLWNVLENFEWQRVMTYIGLDNSDGENSAFDYLVGENEHERIYSVKTTKDAFAGVFKDGDGRDGFLFVNYDSPTSKEINKIDVQFRNCTKAVVYVNGQRKQVDVNNGAISIELKASDAAFIIPLYI